MFLIRYENRKNVGRTNQRSVDSITCDLLDAKKVKCFHLCQVSRQTHAWYSWWNGAEGKEKWGYSLMSRVSIFGRVFLEMDGGNHFKATYSLLLIVIILFILIF